MSKNWNRFKKKKRNGGQPKPVNSRLAVLNCVCGRKYEFKEVKEQAQPSEEDVAKEVRRIMARRGQPVQEQSAQGGVDSEGTFVVED